MSAPDPRCPWCGERLPPPADPPDPAARCPGCGAGVLPPGGELLILDDPPSVNPPAADAPAEPLPDAAFDDVPVVRPAARLPEARPLPRPAALRPAHVSDRDEPERPRPRVGLAVLVLLLLAVAVCGGLSVIGYAIWAGFKTVSKQRRADSPPALVAPCDRGATRVA